MMEKEMTKIKAIYGPEPMREGEYPTGYEVGRNTPAGAVTEIKVRHDNFGDHGIGWFDVYAGEKLIASMNQRATAEVYYQ